MAFILGGLWLAGFFSVVTAVARRRWLVDDCEVAGGTPPVFIAGSYQPSWAKMECRRRRRCMGPPDDDAKNTRRVFGKHEHSAFGGASPSTFRSAACHRTYFQIPATTAAHFCLGCMGRQPAYDNLLSPIRKCGPNMGASVFCGGYYTSS